MDIPAGNGQHDGGDALAGPLHHTGLVAAGNGALHLMADVLLLRQLQRLAEQIPVHQGGAVAKGNSHARAGAAHLAGLRHIAQIVAGSALQGDAHVRGLGKGRALRAPAAHLLLGGEHRHQVAGVILLGRHQAEQVVNAHPVVQGLGASIALAVGHIRRVEADLRALGGLGFSFLPVLRADVHVHIVIAQDALAVRPGLQVDGRCADDAGELLIPHQHPLGDDDPGIHAAQGTDLEEAFLRGGGHDEAHLVHVGGEHHPPAVRALAFPHNHHIAHPVDDGGHSRRLQLLQQIPAQGLLIAGGCIDFRQCLQIHRSTSQPGSSSLMKWASRRPPSSSVWVSMVSTEVCMYFTGGDTSTQGTPARATPTASASV